MKTLVSWLAFNNDFKLVDNQRMVDPDGPTANYHRYHFKDYDRHLILSQEREEDLRLAMLLDYLKKDFPDHTFDSKYMDIKDVIDMEEIKSKVEAMLVSLPQEEEIDIFISPGTPAMQAAWYILQMSGKRAGKLWQLRKDQSGNHKELVEARINTATMPYVAIMSNRKADAPIASEDFWIAPSIQPTYDLASQAAVAHGAPVLIKGETGTGKEHLARTIHELSSRRNKEFKAINCGALTESLLESQLFGYEKGAFTGASKRMPGLFESCNGGTLFLDEIAELSPNTQSSLLRVLQSGEVWPIMATKPIVVDVRVVAASHGDLYQRCQEKSFRWDLYYRLAVIELELPPLREWKPEDRKELFHHISKREARQMQLSPGVTLDKQAMDTVLGYSFPGNVREMENLVRRLLAFHKGTIGPAELPAFIRLPRLEASLRLEDMEKALIEKVLKMTDWNISKTSEIIDCAENTLRSKIKKFGIPPAAT